MGFFRRKHLKQATSGVDDGQGYGYSSAANEQLMTVNDVDDGYGMNDWHQDDMEYGRMANDRRGGGGGGARETASVASKSVGEALAPKDQFDLYIPMRETVKPKATTKPSKLGSKIKNDKRGIKGAAFDETSTASSITCATRDFVISPSKKKSPRNKASISHKMNMKQQSRRLENITELNEANDDDNEVSNNNVDRYESNEGRNGRPNVVGNDALYGPTTLDPPATTDPVKMSGQNRQQAVDSAVLSIEESMRKLDADTKKIGQSLTLAKQKRQQYQQQIQQRQRKQQNQVDGFEMEQRQEKNPNNVRARRPSQQRSDGQYHTDPPMATFELIDGNRDAANVPHETTAVDPSGQIMHVTSTPVVSTVDPTNPTGLGQLLSLATKCFIANPNRVKEQVPMTIVPDCTPRPEPQRPGDNLSTPPPPSSLMQFQREASGIRGADFVVGTQFFSQRAGVELKDEAQVGDNVLLDYAEETDIIVPTPLPLMEFVDDGRDDDGDNYHLRDNEYSVAVNFGYGEDYDDCPVGPGRPKDRSERVARPPTKPVGVQKFTPPRLSKNRSLPKIRPPQLNHAHQQRRGNTKNSNANDNSSKRSSSINGRTTRGSSTTKTNTTSSGSHHQKRFGRRTRSGLRHSRGYHNKTPGGGGGVKIDDPAELFS